jgi:carbonic anhydrase
MSTYPPHFAKNVYFGCIDDRLVQPHISFVNMIGGAFCPALAGGALAFTFPEQRDTALKQIIAAYSINHIDHIYIESHTDCGAYGMAGIVFNDFDEEVRRLYQDLEFAKTQVVAALLRAGAQSTDFKVVTRLVDPEGNPHHQSA